MKCFIIIAPFSETTERFVAKWLFFKACGMQRILQMQIQHQILNHLIIGVIENFFDNERTNNYINWSVGSGCFVTKKENLFSSIAGNNSSTKTFAHDFSKAFCSRAVRPEKLSVMDNCRYAFSLNDIENTCFHKLPLLYRKTRACVGFTTKYMNFSRYYSGAFTPNIMNIHY